MKKSFIFTISNLNNKKQNENLYVVIAMPQEIPKDFYAKSLLLYELISNAQYQYPHARVFILPESVFPFYEKDKHDFLAKRLSNYCHHNSYILFGAYSSSDNMRFNSCMCIYQGKVIYQYNKQFLVPFFEYIPSMLGDMLFSINGVDFSFGSNNQEELWNLSPYGSVKPMMCAELFWLNIPMHSVVVGFINDRYFRYAYFPKIMRLYGDYKASVYKSKIYYSSYVE